MLFVIENESYERHTDYWVTKVDEFVTEVIIPIENDELKRDAYKQPPMWSKLLFVVV